MRFLQVYVNFNSKVILSNSFFVSNVQISLDYNRLQKYYFSRLKSHTSIIIFFLGTAAFTYYHASSSKNHLFENMAKSRLRGPFPCARQDGTLYLYQAHTWHTKGQMDRRPHLRCSNQRQN